MNQMSAGRHAQTALVVDASPEVQQVLQFCLGGIGFRVESVETAAAIDRFRQLAPDLVVVDLQPSGAEALRLCRVLREATVVPIMVLNGSLGDAVKLAAFEAGADDHLDVPFQEKELVARARALMRRARWSPEPQGPIRVGEIEIRLDQRVVLAAETRLRFRPLEFDLLAFLARRPGCVHSRNELLDAVWGTDYPGGPRTVDSHVLELRRKLAQAEVVDPSIQTVWGVGYTLEVKGRDHGPVRIPVSKYSPTAA